jgi:predicted nucleotidyltransferase
MSIFILVPFVIISALLIGMVFSRKSRNANVDLFVGHIVEDLGELAEVPIKHGRQKLRLLRCEFNGERFLVVESETHVMGGFNVNWIRLDDSTIDKLAKQRQSNSSTRTAT